MSSLDKTRREEIRVFLPDIGEEELERRALLLSYRNAASAMLGSSDCDLAKHLAWSVIEWAAPNVYAPAPLEWLDKLNLLSKRLMITAVQAEEMALDCREVGNG